MPALMPRADVRLPPHEARTAPCAYYAGGGGVAMRYA